MICVLGHNSALLGYTSAGDNLVECDEIVITHAPGAESIAQPVSQ